MIKHIPISDLTALEKNPRKISKDQFAKLCKSLVDDPDFFDLRPCLVNKTENVMVVYAGNQRVLAAKKIGWKQVPCIVEENVPEEVMKQRIVLDNKHYGDWDFEVLGNEWEVEDLLAAGFNMSELHLDIDLLEPKEAPSEKKTKEKLCPNCGHQLSP